MKRRRTSRVATQAISVRPAVVEDAATIVALRNAAADVLTATFGRGHWSSQSTERGVLRDIATSLTLVAEAGRRGPRTIMGVMRLSTTRPWGIDASYFTPIERAIYLTGMAVHPKWQRRGVGRAMLEAVPAFARGYPTTPTPQSIRLDAYAAAAGAGGFYRACGYREVGGATYRGTPLRYFELLLSET